MGASLSNLTENGSGNGGPGLGDIPESCVACVFLNLTPPEICNLARLNRAFRGAASSDAVWEAKLPPNFLDDDRSLNKLSEKEKKLKTKCAAIGAVLMLIVAITLTSKNAPTHNSSNFSQDSEKCIDNLNEAAALHPLLQELVKTPFFRYFKVKLWCDCPFWHDDGMCKLRDCSVCECPENEFPEPFKKKMTKRSPRSDLKCQEEIKLQAAVDRTIDSRAFRGWIELDNPWTHDDETDNSEMTYVNLQLNPERYTGYNGSSARRIWDAIYIENCPKYSPGELCREKRILYKLVSGLHSSISIHIASDYLLDETNNLWGRNMELMYDRVLRYPERVKTLYFTFLFVLNAVTRAADYLEQAEYDTGNLEEDLTKSLMQQLIYNKKLQTACPLPFYEDKLWKGQKGPWPKQEIQKHFRNFSALMDCVGCEKCRLWGKLQVLGLGTALKILFSADDDKNIQNQPLQFQRNEVIALLNLLSRLSESVELVREIGPSVEKTILNRKNS